MSFYYGIAWIFLFEMSHHTSLSVKYPGRSLNFPPAQSCFELSFGKASSAVERATSLHPPSIIELVYYTNSFFFCFFGYENFRNFIFWPKLTPTCTESVVRGNLFEKQGFICYRPVNMIQQN